MSGLTDATNFPGNLPNDIDEPGSAELASDLVREQETGPVPLGPATPVQGEDAVLFVETIAGPEPVAVITPTETLLAGADLEVGIPWYQSRWMLYLGVGVIAAAATALSVGTILLLRNRTQRTRTRGLARSVTGPLSRARMKTAPRAQGRLSQWTNQLSGQASKLSGQAQGQLSRLAQTTQGTVMNRTPRRQASAGNLLTRTQQQLSALSTQANAQLRALSTQTNAQLRSLGTTTRATTTRAVGKTQEGLTQVGQGMASGAAKTGKTLKRGWKLGQAFTLGATAGALWTYLYTPESGETTRQRLIHLLPRQFRNQ